MGESTSTVVIKLSGIDQLADKVYLNSKWDTIKNNISILKFMNNEIQKILQLFMIVILLFKILLLFLSYKLKIQPK